MRVQCKFLECRRGARIVGRHAKAIATIYKGTTPTEYKINIVYQQKDKKSSKYLINSQSPPSILIHHNKMTLRLKDSPFDLFFDFFETPTSQANAFMDLLHAICRGESVEIKHQPEVKSTDFVPYQSEMRIVLRSEYPSFKTNFPSTLTTLHICGIGLPSVDPRWFLLINLKTLVITDNPRLGKAKNFEKFRSIEKLVSLQSLFINRCDLGEVALTKLPYLTMSLPSSVVHLDLSNNGLFEFPLLSSATRRTLKYFILSSNRISQFPRDLSLQSYGSLCELRLDRNRIRYVPGMLLTFRLDTFFIDENPATNENAEDESQKECSWNNPIARYDREHTVRCDEQVGARETLVEKAAQVMLNANRRSIMRKSHYLPTDVKLRLCNSVYTCFKCSRKVFYRTIVESKILVRQFATTTDLALGRVQTLSHYCLDCVPCRQNH
ncbi:hypothetical protein WR25_15759 [Diploscapter pachys]|uniref:PIF1/LRR1 pleckstrin homology domain-containing protein n=1 Tax=Diploscapter pachys TaxID=2018661 RepID=A0A2A2J564_9BILA|nr:hypothetical protein WR25_15759 [Diploscapter pachys]